jgi:hypothetical protein
MNFIAFFVMMRETGTRTTQTTRRTRKKTEFVRVVRVIRVPVSAHDVSIFW